MDAPAAQLELFDDVGNLFKAMTIRVRLSRRMRNH
jgi:hypothetical protein